jgi:murein DD-endopeptidase MepM/ murein hydrolase activator NlpD
MNKNFIPLIIAGAAAAAYYMTRQDKNTSSSTQQTTQAPPAATAPPPPVVTRTNWTGGGIVQATGQPMQDPYTDLPTVWNFINGPQKMRNDSKGAGHYGAPRSGGTRSHKGVDILVQKGDMIYAPFGGKVTRKIRVYTNDAKYTGFEIQSSKDPSLKVKVFYCTPKKEEIGKDVARGEVLGVAQAINEKYGTAMKNHIHVELWKDGVNQDITPYLGLV